MSTELYTHENTLLNQCNRAKEVIQDLERRLSEAPFGDLKAKRRIKALIIKERKALKYAARSLVDSYCGDQTIRGTQAYQELEALK